MLPIFTYSYLAVLCLGKCCFIDQDNHAIIMCLPWILPVSRHRESDETPFFIRILDDASQNRHQIITRHRGVGRKEDVDF